MPPPDNPADPTNIHMWSPISKNIFAEYAQQYISDTFAATRIVSVFSRQHNQSWHP
jgi:hypothetical protein